MPHYRPSDPLPDVRGKRVYDMRGNTGTTERNDWIAMAHNMLDEAIVLPDTGNNRTIAKDMMVIIQKIIVSLRADRRRPLDNNMRLVIKFGGEFVTLIHFSDTHPRREEHVVNPSN
jgi:hypothetical protein